MMFHIRLAEVKTTDEVKEIPGSAARLENMGGNVDLSPLSGGQSDSMSQSTHTE